MKFLARFEHHALLLLRLTLGGIFIYFGVDAVLDPELHLSMWFAPWVQELWLIGTPRFVFALGVAEVLLGLALIVGVAIRWVALLAAVILLGIIINLGLNQIAYRDMVLFAAALVLATRHDYRWALKPEVN